MIIDLSIFKEVIQVLKTNTLQNVVDSLETLEKHYELVKEEYNFQMQELKHMFVHYKKYESQKNFRTQSVEFFKIQPWIPLLKKYQTASVYPDVKKTTVSRIIEARRDLENMEFSLEELRFKTLKQAKDTKLAANAILKIEKQIFVLETAIDVDRYFEEVRYNIREIGEFEVKKYYDVYQEGRGQ